MKDKAKGINPFRVQVSFGCDFVTTGVVGQVRELLVTVRVQRSHMSPVRSGLPCCEGLEETNSG